MGLFCYPKEQRSTPMAQSGAILRSYKERGETMARLRGPDPAGVVAAFDRHRIYTSKSAIIDATRQRRSNASAPTPEG